MDLEQRSWVLPKNREFWSHDYINLFYSRISHHNVQMLFILDSLVVKGQQESLEGNIYCQPKDLLLFDMCSKDVAFLWKGVLEEIVGFEFWLGKFRKETRSLGLVYDWMWSGSGHLKVRIPPLILCVRKTRCRSSSDLFQPSRTFTFSLVVCWRRLAWFYYPSGLISYFRSNYLLASRTACPTLNITQVCNRWN